MFDSISATLVKSYFLYLFSREPFEIVGLIIKTNHNKIKNQTIKCAQRSYITIKKKKGNNKFFKIKRLTFNADFWWNCLYLNLAND